MPTFKIVVYLTIVNTNSVYLNTYFILYFTWYYLQILYQGMVY